MSENNGHQHNYISFFGKHGQLYFSILSGVFLIITFFLSKAGYLSEYIIFGYLISYFFGSFFTVQDAFGKLVKGKFEVDFLMFIAALGAAYIDKWAEGALLLFLFSLGHALEHYALDRAENAISSLGNLMPDIAYLKKNNEIIEVPVAQLKVNDIILVKAHEQIAADGVVISGEGSVNQAPITGESMPVHKKTISQELINKEFTEISNEYRVFAGTLNGGNPLEIKVMRLASQSAVSKMIEMVSEAKAEQSPTQLLTHKIEKYYVPAVLVLVILLSFIYLTGIETFNESFYRAITVLVASSPCALAIGTPGAVLSGIARGANKGVLFKGGAALENLGSIDAIAFDKTGTLTEGKPEVIEVISHEIDHKRFLSLAVAIESFSNHPLALAIQSYGEQYVKPIELDNNNVKIVEGKGIEAIVDNSKIKLGRLSYLGVTIPNELESKVLEFKDKGYTLVGMADENNFLGLLALQDKPKESAFNMIKRLRSLGIEKIVMLTGDQQSVANNVGNEIGIHEVYGGLYPENKVDSIKLLNSRYGKTAMIGDGVNDAPAMANSTVSIAMGAAGSDVALETADIALLSDKIEKIPFAVGLSRKVKQIIKQNLYISLGSIILLIPLAAFSISGIGFTILIHEGTTVLVVLNALRLLSFKLDK